MYQNQPVPSEIGDEIFGHCLLDMNDILVNNRFDLKEMDGFKEIFPFVDSRQNRSSSQHLNSQE